MEGSSTPRLEFRIDYPNGLSQWKIFFRWLFIIPHVVVLAFLWTAVYLVTIFAWFAILITGKYPESLWHFTVGALRWSSRVTAYYLKLRDEYPPFALNGEHPVSLDLEYPPHLSRGLIFVKSLLVLPSYVLNYLLFFAVYIANIFAWFAILFTGNYPKGMFALTVGWLRWSNRIMAYLLLLTDDYPVCSLDQSEWNFGVRPSGAPADYPAIPPIVPVTSSIEYR